MRSWVPAFLLVFAAGTTAHADVCPAPDWAPSVASIDSQARKEYLARAFDREVEDIDAWSWTWGSIYGAGTVAQAILIPLQSDHLKRVDYEVGAISTAFGAASLTILPLQLTLPMRGARRHLEDPNACAALARGEHTLFKVEKDQALATSIVGHIGNVVVNIGIALILGLGYKQWSSAAISSGVGVAIGEANAFTQPHHLREVLERYRDGQIDPHATPTTTLAWSFVPVATPVMAGAAIVGTW